MVDYTQTEKPKDVIVDRELQRIDDAMKAPFAFVVLHRPPKRLFDGLSCICDGVDWDPMLDGIKRPIWYDAGGPAWKAF